MKQAAPYLAATAALAAVFWALSLGTLPPADFTFCNGTEIKTVDPAIVTGQPEGRVVRALFEGLCSWDPKNLKPVPGVAQSWEVSTDKLTHTFHLRKDALWTDGTPLAAEDFVYSFRRFLHPKTAAEYAYELWYPVGAKQFNEGKVEVGDPVEVELKQRPPGGLPFSEGVILRGRLLAIEGPPQDAQAGDRAPDGQQEADPSEMVYVVEIDGRKRRFQKSSGGASSTNGQPPPEDYQWLLYDFRSVGIRALDNHTLQISLTHPVPYFVSLMGFYPMCPVNRKCVQTHGYPQWTKPENIVTNGPFQLEFRRIRDRLRLVKSPTYWDHDNVHLEVVDVLAVASTTTALNLYMTGEADWIPTVPTEIIPDLLARKQGDFKPSPYLATYYYLINTEAKLGDRVEIAVGQGTSKRQAAASGTSVRGRLVDIDETGEEKIYVVQTEGRRRRFQKGARQPQTEDYLSIAGPLGDARVRRALGLAIDKREIVEKITRAGQVPARSMVPIGIRDYVDYTPSKCEEHDVSKARQLLAEWSADWVAGGKLPKITILYNTNEAHKAIAELIQSQWKKSLGIDVSLQNQEWSIYLANRRKGEFDVTRAGWIGDYIDPNTFLNMFTSDNPTNHTRWKNSDYDDLLERARVEKDDKQRMQLFSDAERILLEELPVIPLYFYVSTQMVRPYVKGLYSNLLDTHPLKGVRIDRQEKARVLAEEGLR